jgi:predicted Rossmann fold nucleotide-binding protein DprA/Smf involved in DNA uptake
MSLNEAYMKIAIIGSRNLSVKNLEDYIPENVTEIVSGGAKGIDSDAADYALNHGIRLTVFLPEYARYKRGAPLKRNMRIAEYADECIAFWDGKSKGTMHTVGLFQKLGKNVTVIKK